MRSGTYNISFGVNARIGTGSLNEIGQTAQRIGLKKPLIVCDPMMVKIGYADKIRGLLSESGIECGLYDHCVENPTASDVAEGAVAFKEKGCDGIIALGGGSPMDQAKGIRVVARYGGAPQDYNIMGGSRAREIKADIPPMMAIPTTSGTGSEVTKAAVITDKQRDIKFIIVSPFLYPTSVILDPELTKSMPPNVTAATGLDALVHALEAFVSVRTNPIADSFGRTAFMLIGKSLQKAVETGDDLDARTDMSLASMLAGLAFDIAGLGAVHALAHPLGGRHHIAHGLANSIMMPQVMRYNAQKAEDRYIEALGFMDREVKSAEEAAVSITQLSADIGLPTKLSAIGIKAEDLVQLSKDALADPNHFSNPVPCTEESLLEMYKQAL